MTPDGDRMTEYRASFDATVSFSNGGDLTVHGFRVDVPSPDVSEAEIAAPATGITLLSRAGPWRVVICAGRARRP